MTVSQQPARFGRPLRAPSDPRSAVALEWMRRRLRWERRLRELERRAGGCRRG